MAEQLAENPTSVNLGLTNLDPTSIEYGLDVILSHLKEPYFPRRISTYLTAGRQIVVKNKAEAIARFKQSKSIDCRISAYPYPVPEINGVNAQIPYFFLSDLDKKSKTNKALDQCLQQSLQNYDTKLHGAKPTVIWSGGGYHLLQSVDADIVLETDERAKIFREFISFNPSRELMRYAEMLMTNDMADPVHNGTVSFGNCMIRIPNSYNSKYLQKPQSNVRIVQLSNDYKPNIRYLLEGLWEHLIQL